MSVQKRGNRYRARVKWQGVEVASRSFTRKREAVQWEDEQLALLRGGDYVSPQAGRLSVAALAAEYIDHRRGLVSVRSWESDESAPRFHIVPALGRLSVSSVTSVRLTRFLGDLASSRSPGTAARVRTTLRGLFAYAVETRRIVRSPAASVPVPRPDEEVREVAGVNPFTHAELLDVVAEQRAVSEGKGANVSQNAAPYADVTLVLGMTGLRMGELRGLRVCDVVSVPYPALLVQRSHPQSARTGRVIERKRTKGGRSRLVPMLSEVQQVVGEWVAGRCPDDLLFPSPEGSFLRSGNWRRTVHWDETCRGRRPHDLRHTAATLWLGAGVDVETVAAWLGHASTKLTLDTYGHWMGTDADRAAISRLEAALGAPAGVRCGGQAGASGSAGRAGEVGSDA